MRVLSAAVLTALALATALPAAAQEDPNLPGVRVTIQPRSYLDPGTKVRPHTARDYAKSNLTGNTFQSSNYSGVIGFERFPLHDTLDLPYSSARYVLRAPDRE
ncbi:hypothetical protein IZ6_01880 [Terrihabitans soli]|uniref:Uncharacterized protein n=1 Tax=Terrihabitans soli TaxID=708113 RepID=A0A6S6QEA4_9HYPH|nr:hypothetical protein [Terrihabitans soli]BCJ89453.1 hypothetical protein IZ6_01880 [Terrihabitans soli]